MQRIVIRTRRRSRCDDAQRTDEAVADEDDRDRQRLPRRRAQTWSSLTVTAVQKTPRRRGREREGEKRRMPVMTLATAEEKRKDVRPWRVLVGNLAAGAVAGCTVEAGTDHTSHFALFCTPSVL